MTVTDEAIRGTDETVGPVCVEVVVPVYNEEWTLGPSVRRLRSYLDSEFPFSSVVTVVDNGSTDATPIVAADLARELKGVRAVRLVSKGRGRALRAVWSTSSAQVVAYTDVDLSTSLDALLPLVAPLLSGHSDVAIGTRLARGAHVVRGPKRELISRTYNLLLKTCLRSGFSDAQCGFKAVRTDVARHLLPQIEDNEWFFDTELLVLAERHGYRIHEVPVDWIDDPDSRVDIIRTARDDLRGLVRLCLGRGSRPTGVDSSDLPATIASFARIGVASTGAYLVLFFVLAGPVGRFGANALALAVCTVANAAVHRRYTFAGRGRPSRRNLVLGGAAAFSTSVSATSATLAVVDTLAVSSPWVLAASLVAANGAAALVRFVVLRGWMFRTAQTTAGAAVPLGPVTGAIDARRASSDAVPVPAPWPIVLTERQTG
ncbi:MAG TPA: glycosyltransferase [Acidimicrobiales bacterium]|nr:glycosyltransferase [Acidimicrobiales bacterium]